MTNNFPYRKNVQMWVFRPDGKMLVNEEGDTEKEYWKFPQGGIEENEDLIEAVRRELSEEVNITDYKILAKAKYHNQYDFPLEMQQRKKLRGQSQTTFLVFINNTKQVKINEPGIRKIGWFTFEEALGKLTFQNQIEAGKIIWKEFAPIIEKHLKTI